MKEIERLRPEQQELLEQIIKAKNIILPEDMFNSTNLAIYQVNN